MKRLEAVRHEFVEYVPEELEEGVVYVSVTFGTAAHKCCCGCGRKVVTPITPTDWRLTFDGETISLDPSIGSWNLPCQSHYWIIRNKVRWDWRWSKERIENARTRDRELKERYFHGELSDASEDDPEAHGLWDKLLDLPSKLRPKD